jgi:catechol 2,3-dioxygenase
MNRKNFLASILGMGSLLSLKAFSAFNTSDKSKTMNDYSNELFATFGAIHLNNTSIAKATEFWTRIVGLKLRKSYDKTAEFGSENKTLIVVHEAATAPYMAGYSGMYHVAIHAATASEFAKMMYRIFANNYPCSPTDHTMSKSVYLTDYDGVTIEITLETPERFKRVVTTGGLKIEAADGSVHSASSPLDVEAVMKELKDKDLSGYVSDETKIGHIHLYANSVEKSNTFYRQMGFEQFNFLPQFMYADVGAGGTYHHRIVMNSWHGPNRPLAPAHNAGMRHYHIVFKTKERLTKALNSVPTYEEKDGGFWVNDPTGNLIFLTHA